MDIAIRSDVEIIWYPSVRPKRLAFFLPFALLEANTLRPLAVAIRSRKPCLFFLFRFDG